MPQHPARLAAALLALAAAGCVTTSDRLAPSATATGAPPPPPQLAPGSSLPAPVIATTLPEPSASVGDPLPAVDLAAPQAVVQVEAEAPRYAPPESLKRFRYAKPPVEKPATLAAAPTVAKQAKPVPARPGESAGSGAVARPDAALPAPATPAARVPDSAPPISRKSDTSAADRASNVTLPPPTPAAASQPANVETPATELPTVAVATVTAQPEPPRYKLPDSLQHWGSGRKVPLYVDPDAAPWQADATEPRLQNAAVSCNYKDEGGVRGKAMLLVDNHKLTRFTARIEMPNGGICQFDSKKMAQRPFEQGIALQSKDDECIVRMWEQKHRITIAAYSCHKQCSRGSFSYLWPIIMDTRVGTCY